MRFNVNKTAIVHGLNCGLRDRFLLFVVFFVSLVIIAIVLRQIDSGFDLTDESFNVLWISDPWIYSNSATQFGFIIHPIYMLADGSIVLLRMANIFITWILAFLLSAVLFQKFFMFGQKSGVKENSIHGMVVAGWSAALASTSLLSLYPWWPTPNYNSLEFQALLLAGMATLLAERDLGRTSLLGWLLLGVAGWLSFMAKPTSAAGLAVLVLGYSIAAKKFNALLALLSAAVAVLLVLGSALLIDGSVVKFVERLRDAAELYRVIGAGHTLWSIIRWDELKFAVMEGRIFLTFTLSLAVIVALLHISMFHRYVVIVTLLISALSLAMAFGFIDFVAWLKVWGRKYISYFSYGPKVILAVPLAVIIGSAGLIWKNYGFLFERKKISIIIFLLLMPYIFAAGTTNSYWFNGPMAGIFWVLASLYFFYVMKPSYLFWGQSLPVVAASQLITVTVLLVALEAPYRQVQALRLNDTYVSIGEGGVPLRVAAESASYFSEMRRLAQAGGLRGGETIIDLTGYQPGAAVILGAKPVGQPWLSGGYPGSRSFVQAVLDSVPCDKIARAWVLTEPGGRRALPSDILMRYGIDLLQDYASVGTFQPPQQALSQVLLRPVRNPDDAKLACESKRKALS